MTARSFKLPLDCASRSFVSQIPVALFFHIFVLVSFWVVFFFALGRVQADFGTQHAHSGAMLGHFADMLGCCFGILT